MPFLTQGKTNRKFLLIVVVLAVIVGGLIFGYLQLREEEFEIPPVGISEKEVKDETADLIPSEVEGWQIYRNEEYGFEIEYPGQFIMKVESVKPVSGTNFVVGCSAGDIEGEVVASSAYRSIGNSRPVIYFIIFPFVDTECFSSRSFEEYIKELEKHNDVYEKLQLQDITIYKFKNLYDNSFNCTVYVQNKNGDVIRFFYQDEICMLYDEAEYGISCLEVVENNFAEKILSTLSFINEDEIADWLTYWNEKYNYEFKYPKNYRIAYSVMEKKALEDITIREDYREEYSIEDLVVITNLSVEEEQKYLETCAGLYGGCYVETNFPPGTISLRPFFTADRDIQAEVKEHESLTEEEKYHAAPDLSNFRTEEIISGPKVRRWRLNWTMQGKNYEMASINLPEKVLYPPIYHGDTDYQYLDEITIRMRIGDDYEEHLLVLDKILSTFRFLE